MRYETEWTAPAASPHPRLRHEAPAVVLVLDVGTEAVVHATTGALDLGGDVDGPSVSARAWARAAGLARYDGQAFAPGEDPVSRAATGQEVPGEPVLVPGALGRRPMWATAFPLPTRHGERQALLVLVEIEDTGSAGDAEVRDRAVIAAGLSFTISDPRQPDAPLVFVNPAFERTTGYPWDEAIGRNCRFLQGERTDPAAVARVREALTSREHAVVTLLNYRKDGTAFWNELSLSPVYDGAGTLTHFVGIQADVTARVLAEHERADHLRAAQQARDEAEVAQRRLALLAEATTRLASTLDVDQALDRLGALVVPRLADVCLIEMTDGDERRTRGLHAEQALQHLVEGVGLLQQTQRTADSPVSQVLRTGEPLLLADLSAHDLEGYADGRARRGLRVAGAAQRPRRAAARPRPHPGRRHARADVERAPVRRRRPHHGGRPRTSRRPRHRQRPAVLP